MDCVGTAEQSPVKASTLMDHKLKGASLQLVGFGVISEGRQISVQEWMQLLASCSRLIAKM